MNQGFDLVVGWIRFQTEAIVGANLGSDHTYSACTPAIDRIHLQIHPSLPGRKHCSHQSSIRSVNTQTGPIERTVVLGILEQEALTKSRKR